MIIIKVKKRLHGAEGDFWLVVDIELMNGEYRAVGLLEDIKRISTELRNMVKARDIIGGIYVYFLVLAGFLSYLSAVWFGNIIARHISLPLEKLTQKAREIAKGNFDINVEVPQTGDEVQDHYGHIPTFAIEEVAKVLEVPLNHVEMWCLSMICLIGVSLQGIG